MENYDVIIIGAGIGGLSLATGLIEQGLKVCILEKAPDAGGVIEKTMFQQAHVPLGPRVFLASRAHHLVNLCQKFNEPVREVSGPKTRYLLTNQGLRPFSPLVFLKQPIGLLKYLLQKPSSQEQTIHEYFQGLFGERFVEDIVDPMTHGIWAAPPDVLSIDVLMPKLKFKQGLRSKGPKGLISFPNGLKALCDKMKTQLFGDIKFNTQVIEVKRYNDHVNVFTSCTRFCAPICVIATSFDEMRQIVKEPKLDDLKTSSITTVTFCFQKHQLRPRGSGFLIPRIRDYFTKGVLFDADLLGYEDIDMLTSFIQNAHDPAQKALKELKWFLPGIDEPSDVIVSNYPNKIFQCGLGAGAVISQVENRLLNDQIYLLGAYPKVGVCDVLDKAALLSDTIQRLHASCFSNKA